LKKYEAVFILDLRKVDDEGKAFASEFEKMILDWGGTVTLSQSMGQKTFARPINKRKAGIYYNFLFEVAPEKEAMIREEYRLDERVLRHLIILDERPAKVVTLPDLPPPTFNAAPAAAPAAE